MGYTEAFTDIESLNNATSESLKSVNTQNSILQLQYTAILTKNEASTLDPLIITIEDWMRVTHHIMDYQYVFDMNSYVKNVQDDESERLNRQLDSVSNEVMVKKQMYMMRQRDTDKLRSRIRLLLHSMLFISFFAFLYANHAWFGAVGWALMSVASLVFAIYLILYIKLSSSRRYDDWDILYFNEEGKINAASTPTVDPNTPQNCV